MKNLLITLIIISIAGFTSAQTPDADLNGKIFRGEAIEITPPDVDRRPISYNEVIRFDSGKIISDVLKIYSVDECNYNSFIDERTMVAAKVVEFNSSAIGELDGRKVAVEYSGSIYADVKLSGNLIIRYCDGNELKFSIYGSAE